ncbi:hypothetical protein TNCV_1628221 [Trichonephila clavipes]|nr:hypothetical protein TNCV_1628221 [Trichonephila clavipes]
MTMLNAFEDLCRVFCGCLAGPPKRGYLPARYVLTFLIIWAKCLEYAQRVCLSVTIVAMINHTALEQGKNDTSSIDDTCEVSHGINVTSTEEEGDYLWTPSMQGVVLGAYFYGYVCTQVFGGRMAEIAGGKWVMGISILIASFLTFVTPVAADIGVAAITVVRIMLGLVHGVAMPTAFAMFGYWAPLRERSTLLALCIVGDHIGTILTMPLAGYLCEYGFSGGWPSVYYILGIVGCVWFLFWIFLTYNKPTDHPRISQLEINYIKKGQINVANDQKTPVPWKKVFTSRAVWAIAIVTFCSAWGFTTLLTKLPTYLEVVLHVSIQKHGVLLHPRILPYLISTLKMGSFQWHFNVREAIRSRKKPGSALIGPIQLQDGVFCSTNGNMGNNFAAALRIKLLVESLY